MKITTIMINTSNPEKLAEFWKKFLGVEEKYKVGNFLWLKNEEGQPGVGFQKVSDVSNQPQRIHFDILVKDKTKASEKVKELGGSIVQKGKINNIVADPEGNQFCVYVHPEQS